MVDANARLGFAGTPEFAATILEHLILRGFRPVVVYSQPDRPTGRGRRLRASPVKILAAAAGIPVAQPVSLRGHSMSGHNLDLLIVAAYGLLLPPHILNTPRYGCLNVHASLLPRWRGAAPVERAIMAGDRQTGVSIMKMDEGLDTGAIYEARTLPISDTVAGHELEHQLAELGTDALIACLAEIPGRVPVPQSTEGVTYAHKLTRADTRVDWKNSARTIERQIRALCGRMPVTLGMSDEPDLRVRLLKAQAVEAISTTAAPGTLLRPDAVRPDAHLGDSNPKAPIVIACAQGALIIQQLQINRGKGRPLLAADAVNGYPDLFTPGRQFDQPGS